MNLKEVAERLDGNYYTKEMQNIDEAKLKELGIVVVFGASDDLMEFRGAIYDEAGCYGGGVVQLSEFEDEATQYIQALWCKEDDFSWTYETTIPHETFIIHEDEDKYCRGIVFYKKDIFAKEEEKTYVSDRFESFGLVPEQMIAIEKIKELATDLEFLIEDEIQDSRLKSLALTELEIFVMIATKAVSRGERRKL